MAFIGISIDASELKAAQESLRKLFDNKGLAATLEQALERAIWPAYLRLREVTPVGPSGNLKRAVAYKTKAYPKNGGAVGLIGYNRSGTGDTTDLAGDGSTKLGNDRAFHQWWVEYGTKRRDQFITKVSNTPYQRKAHSRTMKSGKVASIRAHQVSGQNAIIASSFSKRGGFQITPVDGGKLRTDKPGSFFKKAKKGQAIKIPGMPVGGTAGRPPVQTAWNQTRNQVAEILQRELSMSLDAALAAIAVSSTGTVSGDVIQGN